MHRTSHRSARPQRGAASLLVVVVLFFILALVSAYASRNLIFEQRISANNQRATQAFEAAEAGIEFAIASLGAGRVDDACVTTTNTAFDSFRQRHMGMSGTGTFTLSAPQANLRPTCMVLNGGTTCSCPNAAPALVVPVGTAPTFQLRFDAPIAQPGVVRVTSRGCSSIGSQCYAGAATAADAEAEISVLLGLNSALAAPPRAAVTARGNVDLSGGAVTISNGDAASGGITIDSGGTLANSGSAVLRGLPGTPGSATLRTSDTSLSTLDADGLFASLFGMDRATYRTQPAVVRVVCAGDCGLQIAQAISANPGRVVWVEGDVTIDANRSFGDAAQPAMVFIRGNLTVSANLQLTGLLYLHSAGGANTWTTSAGSTQINGAVVAEGALTLSGATPPTIAFDAGVLSTIGLTQGSLVRIPGSWRDFVAGS
ncbi:MAG: PilX N-terminal domain-containing pilus assembly protein [Burkholderiaceae bacterium]